MVKEEPDLGREGQIAFQDSLDYPCKSSRIDSMLDLFCRPSKDNGPAHLQVSDTTGKDADVGNVGRGTFREPTRVERGTNELKRHHEGNDLQDRESKKACIRLGADDSHVGRMATGGNQENFRRNLRLHPCSHKQEEDIRDVTKGSRSTPRKSCPSTEQHKSNNPSPLGIRELISPGDQFWEQALNECASALEGKVKGSRSLSIAPVHEEPVAESDDSADLSSPLPVKRIDFGSSQEMEPIKAEASQAGTSLAVAHCQEAKATLEQSREIVQRPLVLKGRDVETSEGNAAKGLVCSTPGLEACSSADPRMSGPRNRSLPSNADKELNSWLPPASCAAYAKKGVTRMYSWQVECLRMPGVLDGRNLVYCASTSAGKSLVAELLLTRRLLATGKKAMLVLPYVAICMEKSEHMEAVLERLGKRVKNFFGTQGGSSLQPDVSLAVCTIEKANSLVNKLLEEGRLGEISMVVVDELHMVGDADRGYILELLLTKLRYAAGLGGTALRSLSPENRRKPDKAMSVLSSGKSEPGEGLQIVGMSATMANVETVAKWLNAELYCTDFRPVPLEECIKVGPNIYDTSMALKRTVPANADLNGKDPDHIVELCNEVVQEGHSALVFCPSRKSCESLAIHIAKYLPPFKKFQRDHVDGSAPKDGSAAAEELRKSPSGLDAVLEQTLPSGVAYHHAGLTAEERELIELCYKHGVVRVLTATSTLAAGVNLPARRVIFRQPKIGMDFIDATRYKQMAGRAGRAGIDTKGESILICKPDETRRVMGMMQSGCTPLRSCLRDDQIGMKRALLEVIASGMVQTAQDVQRYICCTLLHATEPLDEVVKATKIALRWLCHQRMVEWTFETGMYSTTPLGKAAFGSSMTPDESLLVFEDLARAREGIVLSTDLHILYQVTPVALDLEPDWNFFYEHFFSLSETDKAVAARVGVTEPFLMKMAHGGSAMLSRGGMGIRGAAEKGHTNLRAMQGSLRVCKRFFVAIMLSHLVQEVPVSSVCESFQVPRGTIQGLQESAGRFASMVAAFCERLGWHDLETLISKFQNRVSFGVRSEIVELTEIPFVKAARARALYKAGLRTLQVVAEASTGEIAKALSDFSYVSQGTGRHDPIRRMMMLAGKIRKGARRLILEKAEEAHTAAFSALRALGITAPSLPASALAIKTSILTGSADEDVDDEPVALVLKDENEQAPKVAGMQEDGSEKDAANALLNDNDLRPTSGLHMQRTDHPAELHDQKESLPLMASAASRVTFEQNGNAISIGQSSFLGQGHVHHAGITVPSASLGFKQPRDKIGRSNLPNEEHASHGANPCTNPDEFRQLLVQPIEDGRINAERPISHLHKAGPTGPVDVSRLEGGYAEFAAMWSAQKEFVFDLHMGQPKSEAGKWVHEIEGIAVCWADSPVLYVGLRTLDCDKGSSADSQQDVQEKWKHITHMFARQDVSKIAWDLRAQVKAFQCAALPSAVHQSSGQNQLVWNWKEKSARQGIGEDQLPVVGKGVDGQHSLECLEANGDCNAGSLQLASVEVECPMIDVQVLAWILAPDEESSQPSTLEQMVSKRLPAEAAASAQRAGRWVAQMGRVARSGCCRRAAQVRALHSKLWKILFSQALERPLMRVEMPLVPALAHMELHGVAVDMKLCREYRDILQRKLCSLEKQAHSMANLEFSLTNPGEVAVVLYKRLRLPQPAGLKGKKGMRTDKMALDWLKDQHPIAEVIREHRSISKLLHNTIHSLMTFAKGSPVTGEADRGTANPTMVHKIHGTWLQTSTATGRLSMEEPNLQCVEHQITFTMTEEAGASANDTDREKFATRRIVEVNPRAIFVPSESEWLLLAADYSQIEVRLMAHFAGDQSLIQLLCSSSGDLFRLIAAKWARTEETLVTSVQRDSAKRLVYGILYGMGVQALAEKLECTTEEAALYRKTFLSAFPGVASWLDCVVERCRATGFIETLWGRRRYLEDINSSNRSDQAKAARQAVNSTCQGSAADLIKLAMIRFHHGITRGWDIGALHKLRDEEILTCSAGPSHYPVVNLVGKCRLLLQVHDELVVETHKSALQETAAFLSRCMEEASELQVPLRVKLHVGESWGSLKPYLGSTSRSDGANEESLSPQRRLTSIALLESSPLRRGG